MGLSLDKLEVFYLFAVFNNEDVDTLSEAVDNIDAVSAYGCAYNHTAHGIDNSVAGIGAACDDVLDFRETVELIVFGDFVGREPWDR